MNQKESFIQEIQSRYSYKNDKISGYYDLQGAEVEGAYQNAKKHILIFGTDNKA